VQQPDVVLYYNDFGRPYLPLIERMVQSAKAKMDCRTVVMTMTPSKKLFKLFDHPIHIVSEPNAKTVCLDKARAIVTYMAQADRPCIFTDPDVEFVGQPEFQNDADVRLLWRKSKPSQPVNSGMIFAKPGSPEFWKRYGNTVAGLPSVLHAWWADQLALSVMIGASEHKAGDVFRCHDAKVELLEENDVCAAPERATDKAFAIHYKGWRKGDGWEQYFPRKSAA
jgi:hypothetical protein